MAATNEKMDTASAVTAGDEDDRKLFVGGLPQDAKEGEIRDYFNTYGDVHSITLKTDPSTGRSRGFCFVVFTSTDGLEAAMAMENAHTIKNKKVAIKKAQAKQGKIYVGKLKSDLSDDEIKTHFAQFGTIANIEQPFDKTKNERKNFCFITFDKEDVAKKLLKEGQVFINGHELEIKKVTQKQPGWNQMGGPDGMYGGHGGMMRGGGHQGGGWGAQGGYGGYGGGDFNGGQGQWGGGYDMYGGYGGGQGGYGQGGYGGGYQPQGPMGGKAPRGGPRGRGGFMRGGRGGQRGAQRNTPY